MTSHPDIQKITMSASDVAEMRLGVGLSDTREAELDMGQGPRRYRVVSVAKIDGSPDKVEVTWQSMRDGEILF